MSFEIHDGKLVTSYYNFIWRCCVRNILYFVQCERVETIHENFYELLSHNIVCRGEDKFKYVQF